MTDAVRRRAPWIIFTAALLAYIAAVVHRTSLGVAGVEAIDRFGIGAATLSLLPVVQVAVYAILQVPAGSLIDKFGARAVIVGGTVIMAGGQALLATTDVLWVALAARMLIGAGDAPIFVAANRLIIDNFSPKRVPLLAQVTGTLGQLGQVITAVAVAWQLHSQGWQPAFATLAIAGLVVALFAWVGIGSSRSTTRRAGGAAREGRVTDVLRIPGVQLGFWTHWTGMFTSGVFTLLWGVPFLISGQGLTTGEASAMLVVLVIAKVVTSPFIGALTSRFPLRRSTLALLGAATIAVAWIVLLAFPTPRPLWQLAIFAAVVGIGGPAAIIGLDFARTFGPSGRVSAATGVANMGGFVGTLVGVLLVGVTLQLVATPGDTTYSLDNYRIAFATLALPWTVGVIGILWTRRRTRAIMAANDVVVRPLRVALRDARRHPPAS